MKLSERKSFFTSFAKLHNFDPLLPANWYKRNRAEQINAVKVSLNFFDQSAHYN